VDGERPFTNGQREIERAVVNYKEAVDCLTISAKNKEEQGTEVSFNQLIAGRQVKNGFLSMAMDRKCQCEA